jgi:hypothetical protein
MKNSLFYSILFISSFCFAQGVRDSSKIEEQKSEHTYFQFKFSVPIRANQYAGEINPYTGEKEPWFLPDGISGRVGIGVHYDKWIGVGINTGIDWKGNNCLVVAPLFGSFRLSPQVGEEIRITAEAGYGKSFAIGRNSLVGSFKKISLGIESEDGYGLYMELCQYGFSLNGTEKVGSFSFGFSYLIF